MREPPRLRDGDEDLLAVAMLDAARAYRRPPSSRGRIVRMLGLPAAVATSASATAAVASSLATKVVVLVSAAAVVAGGGMAAYKVHARHEAQRAMASRPALAGLLSRQPRPTDAAPAQAPEPSAAALAATPSRAARSAPTGHPAPARRHAPPQAASGATPDEAAERAPAPTAPRRAPLAGEIALLDAAERAERRHDHAAALASLDAYARTFPDGALLAEAQVLRVSALLGLGDDAAAQAEARSFLARYAPSPLAARVQSMLSQRSRREKEPR